MNGIKNEILSNHINMIRITYYYFILHYTKNAIITHQSKTSLDGTRDK